MHIFKKCNRFEVGNYRSISIPSVLSKIYEMIMVNHIMTIVVTNNLIENAQCGFRSNRDTVLSVFRVVDESNFGAHIEKLAQKLSNKIFCLRRLVMMVSRDVLRIIYFAVVHSAINYGLLVWGRTEEIFSIQLSAYAYWLDCSAERIALKLM